MFGLAPACSSAQSNNHTIWCDNDNKIPESFGTMLIHHVMIMTYVRTKTFLQNHWLACVALVRRHGIFCWHSTCYSCLSHIISSLVTAPGILDETKLGEFSTCTLGYDYASFFLVPRFHVWSWLFWLRTPLSAPTVPVYCIRFFDSDLRVNWLLGAADLNCDRSSTCCSSPLNTSRLSNALTTCLLREPVY